MQEIKITPNESGQRLDKFLHKFMPLAPSSFFYKMLRKKNITLNGKKAEGKEKLAEGDILAFYLLDETIVNFQQGQGHTEEYEEAYKKLKGIQVIYENEHILILNKPAGILSQKADAGDISLNEWLIGYLLAQNTVASDMQSFFLAQNTDDNDAQSPPRQNTNADDTHNMQNFPPFRPEQLATYKPSICNRLDRNTAGLVIGARSLIGSQEMNRLLAQRKIGKYYRMFVKGHVTGEKVLEGYLLKDEARNTVRLVSDKSNDKAAFIKTRYYPIKEFSDKTLVEAELITGKSHQLRIHLAGAGHPLLGDYKYGDRAWNDIYKRKYGVNGQLLYACRLEFPKLERPFEKLSGKVFAAPMPENFQMLAQ
ncbi:MAG: RluA family pseudouridine synthase [Clostridium sp.]|nr:RluA family pseudouridine synthase [Clostridium sp.]